jgi:hypothetical protein
MIKKQGHPQRLWQFSAFLRQAKKFPEAEYSRDFLLSVTNVASQIEYLGLKQKEFAAKAGIKNRALEAALLLKKSKTRRQYNHDKTYRL